MTLISGAFGGGGGSSGGGNKPKLAKDGLDSRQYARLIDLISEGAIEGLKNGHRSIFLDDTALANPGRPCSYSRSGSVITINLTNHGLTIGQSIYIEFSNGTAYSNFYTVTNTTANTFTVTSAESGTTSGTAFCGAFYSRTGTTITITSNNHGLARRDDVYLEFKSGTAVSTETYQVTSVTANTFTVESVQNTSTSGVLLWSTYNFQDVNVYERKGTPNQRMIPFANAIESEQLVNVFVTKSAPVVRTVNNVNVDAVRVTISIPALQAAQSDGDVVGISVSLEIWVQYAGGGFTRVLEDTITGRTGDVYQKDYIINLGSTKPAEIKVVRVTDDATDSRIQDAFSWYSYTEITYGKFNYPYSALIGLRINAEQFSSIPKRSYLVRGLKITIPSNATVDPINGRLIYSGVWDGTFGAAEWCSDPAWVLWDLLTSSRYGFGDFTKASSLDKWSFYSASQYSSELVSNGRGGLEPRFSCNVNIQTSEEIYKTINDMCSIFRAMPYWSVGALTVSQDRPFDAAYLFTLANVTQEGFSYQSSSQKTRATVAVVSYLDLSIRDIAYEAVEDPDAIAKYGVVTKEISAFACTSRGQANRIGRWLLYSEQYENEIITFVTSVDAGVIVRPGQIIQVADPLKAGSRRGGRISSATRSRIDVDNITGISFAASATLSAIMPDGTVETKNVSSITGNSIYVDSLFSVIPNINSIWVYQTNGLQTTLWRVLSVNEKDDTQYEITALSYNPSKYGYVESDLALQERDITNLDVLPRAPGSVTLSETLYEYQDQVRAKIIATWPSITGVNQYQIQWKKNNGNWTVLNKVGLDFEILNITPGTFEFKVYSLSSTLKLSASYATATINALGKTAPPSDVIGLTYSIDPMVGVSLAWSAVPDIDVAQYEIRVGTTWNSSQFLANTKSTRYVLGYLTPSAQTFLVKAIDSSRVYSVNATSVTIAFSQPNSVAVTSTIEDPLFVLNWSDPVATSYAVNSYKIYYGNTYAGSTFLASVKATRFSAPPLWNGSRRFWVVPVDVVGNESLTPQSAVVTIAGAGAPTISESFSGSTLRLAWNAVRGTLQTVEYEVRRGASFATASIIANITATNYSLAANWSGSETFWVSAVDGNGTLGTAGSLSVTISAAPAPTVTSVFTGRDVVLSWTTVKGTLDTVSYYVLRGSTLGTATLIASVNSTAYTLRVDWGGSQRFWIRAIDTNGLLGTAANTDIIVTTPIAPTITQQVVDNNVLLRWTDSTQTLPIEYYELRRGSTWASATIIGAKQGGFTTVFETQSSSYKYWLAGVDSAGNYGTPGSVVALVNEPPDYVLQLEQQSTWAGTKINILTDGQTQVVNANLTETWENHFTSRSWTTIQNQISAGYAYYLMPTTASASYEEEFDYGTVLSGTKVTAILDSTAIAGTTTITPTIRVRGTTTTSATYSQSTTTITVTSNSHGLLAGDYVYIDFTSGTATDKTYVVVTAATNTFTVTSTTSTTTSGNATWIKWITYAGLSEVYATQFRYFRIRYDFASGGALTDDDLLVLNSLTARLSAKRRNDSGTGTANSGDSGGTTVNFNIAFIDIDSISVTPLSTSAIIAVYDFVDAPNPTSFKVLLYNTSGTRVSGSFSWTARGV